MAELDDTVRRRSLEAIRTLEQLGKVQAAYVFGSQVEGRADRWSDIDIAAFMEGVESWDIVQRSRAMVFVQNQVGYDIEVHLFSASSMENPLAGSFAAYVLKHGVPLQVG